MKMNSRFFAMWLALALGLFAVAAQAEVIPFDLEVGYRFLSLKGNEDMYRTQINEREGFLIRSFSLTSSDADGGRYRIEASDLGAGPAGAFHFVTERRGLYRFSLGYRRADVFSAAPGFADPYGTGITQHTVNRTRDMVDTDLEFLPDGKITPFVGYSFNRLNGPGTTTYHFGNDEFLLNQDLSDKDNEFRVGTGFNLGFLYGQVTQGWRNQTVNENAVLAPGAGAGNNPGSVLGQPVTATSITRNDHNSVKTPFTNLYVTGQVAQRLRLIGNYSRFAAKSTGDETETAAGTFSSFTINRFFTGENETASQTAKNNTWRGGARAEFTVAPSVDLFAGYQKEHRALDGTAILNTLYLQSATLGGVSAGDLQRALEMTSALDRDEKYMNVGLSARALGPFSVRAEFRQTKANVTAAPDAEEIVVPGPNQGGQYDRRINTIDLSANYTFKGFLVGAAWRQDSADKLIFRTDYQDRDRIRARAGWASPKNFFRAGVVAEQTKQTNDQARNNLDVKLTQYTADAEIAPITALRFRAAYSQFKTDSSIIFIRPESLTTDTSIHTENGKSAEVGVGVFVKKISGDASYMRYRNTGTTPFDIDRLRARVQYDFQTKFGVAAEIDKDKYDETLLPVSNFEATRYGLYLRYHP